MARIAMIRARRRDGQGMTVAAGDDPPQDAAVALALVFGLVWAGAAALIVALLATARIGSEAGGGGVDALAALRAWGFAAALMLAAPLTRRLRPGWDGVGAALVGGGLCLALVLAADLARLMDLLVAGVVLAGLAAIRGRPSPSRGAVVLAAGLGALGAVAHALRLAQAGYAHALATEQALLGGLHHDALFHAAIVASLGLGGTPSVGLDGWAPVAYHAASHRLVAGLAAWTGLTPLQGYSLFTPTLGLPVLLFLMGLFAAEAPGRVLRRPAAVLGAVALAVAVGAAQLGSFWLSESHMVGLWAALAALRLMARAPSPTPFGTAAALGTLAALTLAAGLAKVSAGAVLGCGVAAFAVMRASTVAGAAAGALAGLGAAAAATALTRESAAAAGDALGLFDVWRRFDDEAATHLALTAVILALVVRGVRRRDGEAPFAAAVGGMAAAALAALSLLRLPAGAGFYFGDVGLWAGLALVARGALQLERFAPPPRVATGVAAAALAAGLLGHEATLEAPRKLADLRAMAASGAVGATPFGRIAAAVARDPRIDGVSVAPDVTAFWSTHRVCWAAGMITPATARRPMLEGLPPPGSGCAITPYYGFADYDPAVSTARAHDAASLCAAASARGMARVLRLTGDGALSVTDCALSGDGPS
jgi:hypothetical protein